ncbi:hypothetical protein ACSLFT_28670 [Streptomyces sp. G6]|uniref:hypothetical protein n=1 Tax=Streptomyces sp. G6 TaxID=1178736 RepID=UPI003EDA909A
MTGGGLVCDIPAPHDGPVRPYPCGPRCTTHSPWREKGLPEPPPGLTPRARPGDTEFAHAGGTRKPGVSVPDGAPDSP